MKVTAIHTGFFKLDGGAMFGVVPKTMWQKMNPPDDTNLCTWAMRALLLEYDNKKVLIDTGIGDKQDDRFRSHFHPHGEENLIWSLQAHGVTPDAITDVILTHLHFDHCGGAIARDGNPAFPNAVYWSNERHWQWAMQPNAREKASFLKENFVPLREMGRVQFLPVRQNLRFDDRIRILFAFGHTEAMMLPLINTGKGKILYCADLVPARWHVNMPYVMAYDTRPLLTLVEKERILERAYKGKWRLFLEHDPEWAFTTLTKDEKGRIGFAAD